MRFIYHASNNQIQERLKERAAHQISLNALHGARSCHAFQRAEKLEKLEKQLAEPRKCLGYRTPSEIFWKEARGALAI